jgi:hypothetical protein
MPLAIRRVPSLFCSLLLARRQVAYQLSLVTRNMMKRDDSVEVIEDSEPERQRQREVLYEQRRKNRAGKEHAPDLDDASIIEISDDESVRDSRPATIVEISGTRTSLFRLITLVFLTLYI